MGVFGSEFGYGMNVGAIRESPLQEEEQYDNYPSSLGKARGMLKQLLSVFLQSRCAFCQRTTPATLCEYCQQKLLSHQLPKSVAKHSPYRGKSSLDDVPLGYAERNLGCRPVRKAYRNMPVFAWGKYEGQLKRAIALMKYDNKPELGRVLGELLGQAWLDSDLIKPRKITVVPIPLHHKKLKSRGFNQAQIIAQSFCQITGYSLNTQALIRVRETKAMFDLNPDERVKNLQGAFKVGKKLPKHPVLLIDDIYTMGTTIRECANVLSEVEVIGVAVVAKTGMR